ncbi:MAG: phosphoglycerate dehydrogenase [Bacillota bacterium]
MKILVSDPIAQRGVEIFQEAGFEVTVKTDHTPEELEAAISAYDGLIVRSQTKVTADVINAAVRLKVIGRAGVGVDNVDVPAATKRGIIVMNAPDGNTISTAEHTVAMLLSLSRNIPQAYASLKAGKWDRKKYTGVEVRGKILGIIGMGRIGTVVAKIMQGMEMQVWAFDPYLSEEKAGQMGVKIAALQEIIRNADYITVHTPLTPETKGMIGAKELEMAKPNLRIINCARGGIIDERALAEAVAKGKIAGAAVDVFTKEPPEDRILMEVDNIVVTPHLGASTIEAQENVAVDVAVEMVKALKGEAFKNAVNLPAVRPEVLAVIKPYLGLAERLGLFLSQITKGGLKNVRIEYHGELANTDVAPLTTAVTKGLLSPSIGEEVNLVNAPNLAKERGLSITESKNAALEDYANLIRVTLATEKGEHSVAGTLFGRDNIRIVQVDDFHIDAVPAGYILFAFHTDQPGIIGKVGTILGYNNINIAGMQVGRKSAGGKAVMAMNVDSQISRKILTEIAGVQGIHQADMVIF